MRKNNRKPACLPSNLLREGESAVEWSTATCSSAKTHEFFSFRLGSDSTSKSLFKAMSVNRLSESRFASGKAWLLKTY